MTLVLVVDDDDDVRAAVAETLEDAGYQVIHAHDGREALAALRKGPRPEVIVLDLMMPEMDGWQFRAEQEKDTLLANIPVVVVSALGQEAPCGAAAYLKKPVRREALICAVYTAVA